MGSVVYTSRGRNNFPFWFVICLFCSRYQGLFYKGNQQIRFHGSKKYSGFLLWLQGRTRNGDGKIGLQHYKECCYDYADWVWVGAGVKTNFLYFFYSFGDRIWFYLVHCVLAIVYVNRGVIKLLFGALGN